MSQHIRNIALDLFAAAMAATTVEAAANRSLKLIGKTLSAGPCAFDLSAISGILIIAIGKAASTSLDAVRTFLPPDIPARAIVSAPSPPRTLTSADKFFPGGHPFPNHASLDAATEALRLLRGASHSTFVLFLISGGASAMCELPCHPAISLQDLIDLNRQLVGSGATIAEINCVRRQFSAVKGGRLAAAAPRSPSLTLLVSDVPDGHPEAVGSGPSLPNAKLVTDADAIVERHLVRRALPPSIQRYLSSALSSHLIQKAVPAEESSFVVLLRNADLLTAARNAAHSLGMTATIEQTPDEWSADAAVAHFTERAASGTTNGGRSCLISGGELTLPLPHIHGVGGRNQHFALLCARQLHLSGRPVTILSAGSDGIDGNSPAAGCVVDETTWSRALALGLDPAAALQTYNAFPLFQALGDAIFTGPSGNNIRDLRILMRP